MRVTRRLIGIGEFIMLFSKKAGKRQVSDFGRFWRTFIGLSFMSGAINLYSDAPRHYLAASDFGILSVPELQR